MKKLLYLLFHRSVFVGLSLLAQIGTLLFMVATFSEHMDTFYSVSYTHLLAPRIRLSTI